MPTSNGGTGLGLTVDIVAVGGAVTQVTIADAGYGYSVGDTVTIDGGNFGASVDVSTVSTLIFDVPGDDAETATGPSIVRWITTKTSTTTASDAFDQNYNGVYDWLDADMGGTTSPDNLGQPSGRRKRFGHRIRHRQRRHPQRKRHLPAQQHDGSCHLELPDV